MSKTITVLSLGCQVLCLAACSHTMEVANTEDYRLPLTDGPRQNVAVLAFHGSEEDAVYHQQVVEALRRHPSVGAVRTQWKADRRESGFQPDVVVDIQPRAEYSGSGWNYLITFPGFLIFTPAWNGYVYHASLETDVALHDPRDLREIEKNTIETEYSMRYCDFGRAFWANIGWWTPGYGAGSALAGLYMITYDGDATDPFEEKVAHNYGDYIAENIMRPVLARATGDGGKVAAVDGTDAP